MGSINKKIKNNINNNFVTFICPKCKVKENIPFYVVDMMDKYDNGNPNFLQDLVDKIVIGL